jgi:hypothetical protein
MLPFCLISKAGSDIITGRREIIGRREQFGTLIGAFGCGYRLSEHRRDEQSVDACCRLCCCSVLSVLSELKIPPTQKERFWKRRTIGIAAFCKYNLCPRLHLLSGGFSWKANVLPGQALPVM